MLLGGHLYLKIRVCARNISKSIASRSRISLAFRILGSSRMLNPLKTDAVPTIFSHRKATPVRLASVKRAEKRHRLEVCLCVVIMHVMNVSFE